MTPSCRRQGKVAETVDRANLDRQRRVAALSYAAWIALIRRLALFFGRIRPYPGRGRQLRRPGLGRT